MSLPAAMRALEKGLIPRPVDDPTSLAGMLPATLPARPPAAKPEWQRYIDTAAEEVRQQQAIDRAAMHEILARKRSEARVFDPMKVDMRQQFERSKRFDAALAMMEDENAYRSE
jgi:hypothetical protein